MGGGGSWASLDPSLMNLSPAARGPRGQITKKKNSCRATVPGPRLLDSNPDLQCSGGRALVFLSAGGEASKTKKPLCSTGQSRLGALYVVLELGNAISRRGNWGPHNAPSDHVAEQASRSSRT